MTDPTPGPRNDVLAERISGLNDRFTSLEKQISGLATKEELIQLLAARDALTNSQLSDLREDVKNLTIALANERAERMAADTTESTDRKTGDKENEERANRARTFPLSAIGLVISVVLGLIALINQVGGPPS